jgi:TolB-like protein/class 3 adenylate cyclase/Flp pilus assembly protein TadD
MEVMASRTRKLAAVMFTDIVGYTALMARDEERGIQVRDQHRRLLEDRVTAHGGERIDETGDETLSTFESALDAVACALDLQAVLEDDPDLSLRIGIHQGDIVFEGGRVYGDGVNVASRIRPLAEPGGICVSDEVRNSIRNQPGLHATPLGVHELKNVGRPVSVFALRGEPGATAAWMRDPPGRSRSKRRVVLVAAVACVVLLGAWFGTPRRLSGSAARLGALPGSAPITAIAVLPFVDMSPQGDQGYLSDGFTEEIISALAVIKAMRVVARTSVFAFKGKNEDARIIGAKLAVGSVLEGSVRRADNRVRVTAQLIDVRSGFHLWTNTYERRIDDVFAVQEEIAVEIANALEVEFVPEGAEHKASPPDFRAYEHYLRGRADAATLTQEGLERAIEHYEKALAIDPFYGQPYSGLAAAYTEYWDYYSDESSAGPLLERAEAAARRAIALDENNGEAMSRLGGTVMIRSHDWERADAWFQRALTVSPGSANVHFTCGSYLLMRGRLSEAHAVLARGLELDPLSAKINRNFGRSHLYAGEIDAAIPFLLRARELNPTEPAAPDLLTLAYTLKGRHPEAMEAWLSKPKVPAAARPPLRIAGRIFGNLATLGLLYDAATYLAGEPCPGYALGAAEAHAALGHADRMFECLEKASERHLYYIAVNPLFDPYRSDPRFEELLWRSGYAGRTAI